MVKRANESVFISSVTGWVRVFLNPEENHSTLVYTTDNTTVADISQKINLQDIYTIWVQVILERVQKNSIGTFSLILLFEIFISYSFTEAKKRIG